MKGKGVKGAYRDEGPKHLLNTRGTQSFLLPHPPGAAPSFTVPGSVDSGKRGGCYQLARSEPQGKGRTADKLSGAWALLQAQHTTHLLPWLITAGAMEHCPAPREASPCPQT